MLFLCNGVWSDTNAIKFSGQWPNTSPSTLLTAINCSYCAKLFNMALFVWLSLNQLFIFFSRGILFLYQIWQLCCFFTRSDSYVVSLPDLTAMLFLYQIWLGRAQPAARRRRAASCCRTTGGWSKRRPHTLFLPPLLQVLQANLMHHCHSKTWAIKTFLCYSTTTISSDVVVVVAVNLCLPMHWGRRERGEMKAKFPQMHPQEVRGESGSLNLIPLNKYGSRKWGSVLGADRWQVRP